MENGDLVITGGNKGYHYDTNFTIAGFFIQTFEFNKNETIEKNLERNEFLQMMMNRLKQPPKLLR